MCPGLVGPARQGRNLHLEGIGLAAIHYGAVALHDLVGKAGNDPADAVAESGIGAHPGLPREGVVYLDEPEVLRTALPVADQLRHEEAFPDPAEKLAVVRLARFGLPFGQFRRQLRHADSRSFSELNESSGADVPLAGEPGGRQR